MVNLLTFELMTHGVPVLLFHDTTSLHSSSFQRIKCSTCYLFGAKHMSIIFLQNEGRYRDGSEHEKVRNRGNFTAKTHNMTPML